MNAPAVIGALGAGRMGRGIAHAFAYAGHEVVLIDAKPRDAPACDALRDQAYAEIRANLAALADAGGFDARETDAIVARVRFAAREEAGTVLPGVGVLFEGVPEVLEAKRAAFEFACAHLREDAIVASTTSTMLSTELSGLVPRPERFLNCHWLNPAYLIPLVELSPHAGTDPAVTARLKAILEAIGKKPVECKAAPGFIVPRLQALVMNEAARMVEQGVATAEDVDRAVRYGFGIRYASMGVVEFIDVGGLDILYYASHYLAGALGDPRFVPPAIVDRYMQEGRRGLRDGRGFFDWQVVDANAYRKEVLARQLALLKHLGLAPEPGAALRRLS
ncbi:MAG: 3-hydroxybutyryl-CoA dehydrogenase [Betaproteobacteria bacterium RIFCSPHIGHO2_12_FULL_69_13]|nr:MAG: 3-hydroxybutyryl-CoA dehydrogenase [Betaproteobacteria bacterium RIFCSPHIGHO2_12_FULL_69_13]OGA71040.1 MAG: 3-hydroxybutyryl-CoA dehydrogenase [Betaproteobacteria bacterium RIFCSPLOWO2_12_FULL_68_20]